MGRAAVCDAENMPGIKWFSIGIGEIVFLQSGEIAG